MSEVANCIVADEYSPIAGMAAVRNEAYLLSELLNFQAPCGPPQKVSHPEAIAPIGDVCGGQLHAGLRSSLCRTWKALLCFQSSILTTWASLNKHWQRSRSFPFCPF